MLRWIEGGEDWYLVSFVVTGICLPCRPYCYITTHILSPLNTYFPSFLFWCIFILLFHFLSSYLWWVANCIAYIVWSKLMRSSCNVWGWIRRPKKVLSSEMNHFFVYDFILFLWCWMMCIVQMIYSLRLELLVYEMNVCRCINCCRYIHLYPFFWEVILNGASNCDYFNK